MYKVTIYRILSLILICFSFFQVRAASVSLADSLYKAGKFAEAVTAYDEIAKKDGFSSALLYNMGNAYARGGDYGKAAVCYMKSLRLDPSNKEAKNNLQFIDSKVQESNLSELRGKKYSLERESPSFFNSINLYIVKEHISDSWAIWSAVFFIIFILCLASYIFSRNVLIRKTGFFGGMISLGISAVMVIFAFMASSYRSDEGVIISPKIKLMSDASSSSKESPVNLTRGTRMKVLDSVSNGNNKAEWYKVRLNSDFIGWIPAQDFELVGF